MTTTCDVPPSVEAAIKGIEQRLSEEISNIVAQRDIMLAEMDTLEANVLEGGDALLARILDGASYTGVNTLDEYREVRGVPTTSSEVQLSSVGVHMADGRGITAGGTNVTAMKHLWRLVQQDRTRFDEILALDEGEFVLGVTYNKTSTVTVRDGCGGVNVEESTSEIIVGVDVNVESVEQLGVDPEDINLYCFWIKDSSSNQERLLKFRFLEVDDLSSSLFMNSARLPLSDGTLPAISDADSSAYNLVTSVIIEEPDVLDQYSNTDAGALTDDERDAILDPDRDLNGVDPSVGPGEWMQNADEVIVDTDNGDYGVVSIVGRIPNPSLYVLTNLDIGQTTGFENKVDSCRSSSLDALMTAILDYFEMAFGIMEAVIQAAADGVRAIFNRIQKQVDDFMAMLGGAGALRGKFDMMCLWGIAPFGNTLGAAVPTTLLDEVIDFLNDLADGIDSVLDAMLTLFGLMTTPICIIQSILETIFPPGLADCVGLDITFSIDSECFDDVVAQITDLLVFIQELLDRTVAFIVNFKNYIKFALPGLGVRYQSSVEDCIGVTTLAFAAALEALG